MLRPSQDILRGPRGSRQPIAFPPIVAMAYAFLWPTVSSRVGLFITLGYLQPAIGLAPAPLGTDSTNQYFLNRTRVLFIRQAHLHHQKRTFSRRTSEQE